MPVLIRYINISFLLCGLLIAFGWLYLIFMGHDMNLSRGLSEEIENILNSNYEESDIHLKVNISGKEVDIKVSIYIPDGWSIQFIDVYFNGQLISKSNFRDIDIVGNYTPIYFFEPPFSNITYIYTFDDALPLRRVYKDKVFVYDGVRLSKKKQLNILDILLINKLNGALCERETCQFYVALKISLFIILSIIYVASLACIAIYLLFKHVLKPKRAL